MSFRAAAIAALAIGGLVAAAGLGGAPVDAEAQGDPAAPGDVSANVPAAEVAADGSADRSAAGLVSRSAGGLNAGASAVAETGWQLAAGAYYLGGELVESSQIIGISTLQMLGLLSTEGAQDRARLGEGGVASLWWGSSAGDEPPAVEAPAPHPFATETATPTADPAGRRSAGGDRSLLAATQTGPRSPFRPVALNTADSEGETAPGTSADRTASDQGAATDDICSWAPKSKGKAAALSGEDVAVLSRLGLMDESAQRLPDGTIFLPKVTQRLLEVRTAYTCKGTVSTTRRLVGHVIANPTSSGLVQAEQNGRIEAGEFGFPVIGQRVEKGQLLGYLIPILSSMSRAELQGQIALVRGQIAEQELAIARTRELPLLPFREGRILSLRIELNRLRAQRDALIEGLDARQPLIASVSGVIARSEVRVGQVVEERQLLWEIADTDDLWVEADSFGSQTNFADTGSTAQTQDGQVMDLVLQGLGLSTDGAQSSPVQFRVDGVPDGVRIGQQVVVNVRELGEVEGVLVPRSALVRQGNGEMTVWVAKGPEQYEPRKVKWSSAGAEVAMIEAGLEDGVRVVVAGATLLSEIR
ncbi:efflux RND transporter periplasmic adaptor subunit [Thalassobaculum litoreum]|uniref:Multidrug efflux pump subunit AcrA (Membrane-fusion protein) n=1 Tax=Thalassobaculum litoreum DSM 18839 TaxID=1123362 RepID=A0A8G2F2A9_9PROT|nr:efflux RND transporter periplasmic adaptor subunit [Thalassobaculum litoreum]SDF44492.1 Multidrug efflux pump subunit AcrA (membrane-fusion protein) [Thalassobaculum litoreum DSM 18839]